MSEKRTIQSVGKNISAFVRDNKRMPSYGEMLNLLDVRSKNVVHYWVKKLVANGFLEKDQKGRLTLSRSPHSLPFVGTVQAGFPSPVEEELRDTISLDEYLITRPESSFILEVSGDSMNGAGVLPGDLVIVEKGCEPKNGDIILAEVDGECTMKYFRRQGKSVVLEAANPKYPTIKPKSELRLGGVVSAVIRKYRR
jgi:repressor LexA